MAMGAVSSRGAVTMANWIIRNSDGEFMVLQNGDPARIHTEPQNYTEVEVDGDRCPDPRTQKWNGSEVIAKSVAEIAAYDARQPKVIRTRDLLRRITDAEHDAIDDLAKSNRRVRRLMHLMLADATTDVNHPEFIQGWQFLKSVGIPAIWPDAATADAAIARIRA